jgi:competence ComEA-like helix-hairpin-helix protein
LLDGRLEIWATWKKCLASNQFKELVTAVAATSKEDDKQDDGKWHARLILATLFVKHGKVPDDEATQLAGIAETMSGRPIVDDPQAAAYDKKAQTAAGKLPKQKLDKFGANDRGVKLTLPPKEVTNTQLAAIHSYSKDPDDDPDDNYENFRDTINDPVAASGQNVGRLRSAVAGIQQLPVYQGSVYRAINTHNITKAADIEGVNAEYGPGSIVADKHLYSGSKTIRDNTMFGPLKLAFVIDGVKTGRDMQLMSDSSAEREVVFSPAARFVVTRHEDAIKRGANDKFESGHYWIHMRELDPGESAPDQPPPSGFSDAFQLELKGRRAIDSKDYATAKRHFDSGTPANAGNSPDVYSPPDNKLTRPEKFYDYDKDEKKDTGYFAKWEAADKFTREQMPAAPPITVKHLTDLQDGLGDSGVRSKKADDVEATGGHDIDGKETDSGKLFRIPKARYEAVLARHDHLIVDKKKEIATDVLCSISYPKSTDVDAKLTAFVVELNKRYVAAPADKGAARNKAGVKLAAWAQQTLSAIHPFGDANGRVTRLLMDYLLGVFGLPASLLGDVEFDYLATEKEWASEVATGIEANHALEARYVGAANAKPVPDGIAALKIAPEHPLPGAQPVQPAAQAQVALIDINTATKQQLMTLPDIGPARADAIIAERGKGRFATVDELTRVKTIGAGIVAKLRGKVTV